MENNNTIPKFKIGDAVCFGPPFPSNTQSPFIVNNISGDYVDLILRDNPLSAHQVVHLSFVIPYIDDGRDEVHPIGFDISPED
jgi:hypothetical protein